MNSIAITKLNIVGIVISIVILSVTSCTYPSDNVPKPALIPATPAEVQPVLREIRNDTGGSISLEDGFKIELTAGSLHEDNDTLSVELVEQLPQVNSGSLERVGESYSIELKGENFFRGPVRMDIPYDENKLPGNRSEEEIFAIYLAGGVWNRLYGEVDTQRNIVSIYTIHNGFWSTAFDSAINFVGEVAIFFSGRTPVPETIEDAKELVRLRRAEFIEIAQEAVYSVESMEDYYPWKWAVETFQGMIVLGTVEKGIGMWLGKTMVAGKLVVGGVTVGTWFAVTGIGVEAYHIFVVAEEAGASAALLLRSEIALKRLYEAEAILYVLEHPEIQTLPPSYQEALQDYIAALPIDQTISNTTAIDFTVSAYPYEQTLVTTPISTPTPTPAPNLGQWSLLPSPLEPSFFDMAALDSNHAWVVGSQGTIKSTIDGGRTWEEQDSGTDVTLFGVFFMDKQRGWAVGTSGTILTTIDGGIHWSSQESSVESTLLSVSFDDPLQGYVVGERVVLRTYDGGLTWENLVIASTEPFESGKFTGNGVGWLVGKTTFLGTSDGGSSWVNLIPNLMISIRSEIQEIEEAASVRVTTSFFGDGRKAWIVARIMQSPGEDIIGLFRTMDGGHNWQLMRIETGPHYILSNMRSMWFVDENWGYLSSAVSLYTTSDGGRTDSNQFFDKPYSSGKPIFVSRSHGWLIGGVNNILHTSDGGSNWFPQGKEVGGIIDVLWHHGNIYVVGSNRFVATSSDRGETWIKGEVEANIDWQDELGLTFDLYAVSFPTANTGYAVSKYWDIIKTDDGGRSWSLITSLYTGGNERPNDIFFMNESNGWVVGDGGIMYSTTDGGISWLGQYLIISDGELLWETLEELVPYYRMPKNGASLEEIHFMDTNRGWVVGGYETGSPYEHSLSEVRGLILFTQDSGRTWQIQARLPSSIPPYSSTVKSIYISDNSTMMVTTPDARILLSSDGGTTWDEQLALKGVLLGSIRFLNPEIGWICLQPGSALVVGLILNTMDSGRTWKSEQLPVWVVPTHIEVIDENSILVLGGSILMLWTRNPQ